jgi:NAD(P)-dependent dehydrogenase (short-subunit alcohol dehydrogenase family)
MGDRLKGKIAVVMGAGQTPGETIGNGRASAILYAREGAKVIVVDYRLNSADVITIMRAQRSGAILNISSIAAVCNVGILAYKTSKAGVNAITRSCGQT